MPLTNEAHLRTTLDSLFYKDTILARLQALDRSKLVSHFRKKRSESEESYFARLCKWLAARFLGYSISTVAGRFRAQRLLTMRGAAEAEANGDRYLIDETTAIVRFIFPCGMPAQRELRSLQDFEDLSPPDDGSGPNEAKQIRWFFNALFVQSIIQVVNGEAEIWLIESGMRDRLHIWKVVERQ